MIRDERNLTNPAEESVRWVGRVMERHLSSMSEHICVPTAASGNAPVLSLQTSQEPLQIVVGTWQQGLMKAGEQPFAQIPHPFAYVVDEWLVLRLDLRIAVHLQEEAL